MSTAPVAHHEHQQHALKRNTTGGTDVPAKAGSMNSPPSPAAEAFWLVCLPFAALLAGAVAKGAAEAPPKFRPAEASYQHADRWLYEYR